MSQEPVKRKIIILDDNDIDESDIKQTQADESKKLKISDESVIEKKSIETVLIRDYSLLPQEILTLIFKNLSIKERCQMAR